MPDDQSQNRSDRESRYTRRWMASWFCLTTREQKAVLALLFLFLLGLAVKWWHVRRPRSDRRPPAPTRTETRPN